MWYEKKILQGCAAFGFETKNNNFLGFFAFASTCTFKESVIRKCRKNNFYVKKMYVI